MTTDLHPALDVPLLTTLQDADVDTRPAWVPRYLDRFEVQALVAAAYPELQQAHEEHRSANEVVHAYRDRDSGAWVVCVEHLDLQQRGTVKEAGPRPLWDQLVVLVGMWEVAGRPVDTRSLVAGTRTATSGSRAGVIGQRP